MMLLLDWIKSLQYHKQNGKIIVPSATGTYSTIKATYTVDLIKEKPIAAKLRQVNDILG